MAKKTKTRTKAARPKTGPTVELMSAEEAADLLEGLARDGTMEDGMPTVEVEELVSLELAAEILGNVSLRVVENLILRGEVDSVPLGGRSMVFRSDLTEYVRGL